MCVKRWLFLHSLHRMEKLIEVGGVLGLKMKWISDHYQPIGNILLSFYLLLKIVLVHHYHNNQQSVVNCNQYSNNSDFSNVYHISIRGWKTGNWRSWKKAEESGWSERLEVSEKDVKRFLKSFWMDFLEMILKRLSVFISNQG